MTGAAWLLVAAQVIGAAIAVCVAVALLGKGQSDHRDRRELDRETAVRPYVVSLLTGEALLPAPHGRLGRTADRVLLESLGTFRGEARETLVHALEERGVLDRARRRLRSRRPLRRAEAADVLGHAGLAAAVPDLAALLDDRWAEVRMVAARGLGRIRSTASAEALIAGTTQRRVVPADVVAMALVAIGSPAIEPLRRTLTAGAPLARLIACRVLGHLGALAAVEELEGTMATDPDPDLRVAAAEALGRIGAPSAVAALAAAARAETPLALRVAAVDALGRIGDPGSVDTLAALVEAGGFDLPHRSARALAAMGAPGARALHRLALEGPPAAPHAAEALAVAALADIGGRP